MPVSAAIVRPFGAAEPGKAPSQGLDLAATTGGEVVAPFDGRVTYAGPFRTLGVVLIIRHGGGYHSLLAGLGRVDVGFDQWVVAGEPVGAMPEAGDTTSTTPLNFELRRDGRPVDPQRWVAARDAGRDPQNGNQKVRE